MYAMHHSLSSARSMRAPYRMGAVRSTEGRHSHLWRKESNELNTCCLCLASIGTSYSGSPVCANSDGIIVHHVAHLPASEK